MQKLTFDARNFGHDIVMTQYQDLEIGVIGQTCWNGALKLIVAQIKRTKTVIF